MLGFCSSSILPVPLNSSKMTSSIRLPVSISAEARIVRLPPSSTLRAAPKKRFGLCRALGSTPPESKRPLTEKELSTVWQIRKVFSNLDTAEATETLLDGMKRSKDNEELCRLFFGGHN